MADVGWMGLVGVGTRHSDVTAAELGWYSIAYSPNSPTLLLALPETGSVLVLRDAISEKISTRYNNCRIIAHGVYLLSCCNYFIMS